MLTIIKIRDEILGSPLQAEGTLTVAVSGESISARELIRHRVQQEVERYNQQSPGDHYVMVTPGETERLLNGYKKSWQRKPLALEPQVKKALEAFESNGFIILVGDRQVHNLDEAIVLHPEVTITFLKLVPLVGG